MRQQHQLIIAAFVVMMLVSLTGIFVLVRMEMHIAAMEMAKYSATIVRERGIATAALDVKGQIAHVLNRNRQAVQGQASDKILSFQRFSDSIMRRVANYIKPVASDLPFAGFDKNKTQSHFCIVIQSTPMFNQLRLQSHLLSLLEQSYPYWDAFLVNTVEGDQGTFESAAHDVFDSVNFDPRIHVSPLLQLDGQTKLQGELGRLLDLSRWANTTGELACNMFLVSTADWIYFRDFGKFVSAQMDLRAADVVTFNFLRQTGVDAEPLNSLATLALPQGNSVSSRRWIQRLLDKHASVFTAVSGSQEHLAGGLDDRVEEKIAPEYKLAMFLK